MNMKKLLLIKLLKTNHNFIQPYVEQTFNVRSGEQISWSWIFENINKYYGTDIYNFIKEWIIDSDLFKIALSKNFLTTEQICECLEKNPWLICYIRLKDNLPKKFLLKFIACDFNSLVKTHLTKLLKKSM